MLGGTEANSKLQDLLFESAPDRVYALASRYANRAQPSEDATERAFGNLPTAGES